MVKQKHQRKEKQHLIVNDEKMRETPRSGVDATLLFLHNDRSLDRMLLNCLPDRMQTKRSFACLASRNNERAYG
jgi:hypothetical protein